jgi:hypothetical protein
VTPPTGQPSDADLARIERDARYLVRGRGAPTFSEVLAAFDVCENDVPRLLAAVRDRDARIAELTAEVASLVRRLGDQEKHNIASRRSLCEQRDRYEAAIGRVREMCDEANRRFTGTDRFDLGLLDPDRVLAALDGPQ